MPLRQVIPKNGDKATGAIGPSHSAIEIEWPNCCAEVISDSEIGIDGEEMASLAISRRLFGTGIS
jgi:hypothetical protein